MLVQLRPSLQGLQISLWHFRGCLPVVSVHDIDVARDLLARIGHRLPRPRAAGRRVIPQNCVAFIGKYWLISLENPLRCTMPDVFSSRCPARPHRVSFFVDIYVLVCLLALPKTCLMSVASSFVGVFARLQRFGFRKPRCPEVVHRCPGLKLSCWQLLLWHDVWPD